MSTQHLSPPPEQLAAATPSPAQPLSNGPPTRLPRGRKRWSLKARIFLILTLLGGLTGLVVAGSLLVFAGGVQAYNGPVALVKREKLQVMIVERGTLEAENNNDVFCRVKTIANRGISIKELVDNGALVKK